MCHDAVRCGAYHPRSIMDSVSQNLNPDMFSTARLTANAARAVDMPVTDRVTGRVKRQGREVTFFLGGVCEGSSDHNSNSSSRQDKPTNHARSHTNSNMAGNMVLTACLEWGWGCCELKLR